MIKAKAVEEAIANIDAERLVIGNLFQGDQESFGRASELLSESSFTVENHRYVFASMRELFITGKPINYGTVYLELKARNIGLGMGSLVDLYDGIPGLYNLESFCEQVAEAERLRKLWLVGKSIQERVEQREKSDEIVDAVAALSLERKSKNPKRPSEILSRAGGVQRFMAPSGVGISTPWSRVNRRTNGFRASQLWVIGGLPTTGKTSMALNMAEHAIFINKARVKIVSKEMDSEELLFNMACTRARVDSQAVRAGEIEGEHGAEERLRLAKAIHDLADEMDDFLEIEDADCSTVAGIGASLRRNVAEGRLVDLLIVDYLQLLHGIGRFKDRREEVDQIAYGLKETGKTFRIPVLALAQLNVRKLETEGGAPRDNVKAKRPAPPSLGDFRESGAVEQAADLAWILRRTDVEQQFRQTQLVDAFLLKQRGGRTGKIPFKFHTVHRLFEELPEYQAAA